jgi:hypothetical protein
MLDPNVIGVLVVVVKRWRNQSKYATEAATPPRRKTRSSTIIRTYDSTYRLSSERRERMKKSLDYVKVCVAAPYLLLSDFLRKDDSGCKFKRKLEIQLSIKFNSIFFGA